MGRLTPRKGLMVFLVCLVTVAGLSEVLARVVDGNTFPHVNFYLPDAELGARLTPNSSMQFRVGDNPKTVIHVNAEGYRGVDWPSTVDDAILVVGDSQVFGLGVEDDETFSAKLADITGRTVLNAGVPTYGPAEYAAVVNEVMAARDVSTVVFTVNMANDLFELERPNVSRHVIWDGWAVRTETAPLSVTEFPGRALLFQHSHMVYALRRYWAQRTGLSYEGQSAPSEGTWTDLVATADESAALLADAEEKSDQARVDRIAALEALEVEARQARIEADQRLVQLSASGLLQPFHDVIAWTAARGTPGDIVGNEYAEASRSVALTARMIRKAAQHREQVLSAHVAQLEARDDETARAALVRIEQADAVEASLVALRQSPLPEPQLPSVMAPFFVELRERVEANGAELVVLMLPLDVQVSLQEFEKYDVEPQDMRPSLALIRDAVQSVERLGVRAVDATPALVDAEPGAFLWGDLHMTPKGHAAVAAVLAAELGEPAPLAYPTPGLEAPHGLLPATDLWWRTPEATVRGSSRAMCETVVIDAWLRISCMRKSGLVPTDVEVTAGALPDTFTLVTEDAVTLVTPLDAANPLTATFWWKGHHQELSVRWDNGATESAIMAFGVRESGGRVLAPSEGAGQICACHKEVYGEKACETKSGTGSAFDPVSIITNPDEESWTWVEYDSCQDSCSQALAVPDAACLAQYTDDCEGLLACLTGEPVRTGACPAGQARVGGTRRCLPLCDEDRPCATGNCQSIQGAAVCVF